jgi:hypothetical protein
MTWIETFGATIISTSAERTKTVRHQEIKEDAIDNIAQLYTTVHNSTASHATCRTASASVTKLTS